MLKIDTLHAAAGGTPVPRALTALALALGASPAAAGERCVTAQYDPPASIAEDLRPYILCGMIQGDGHSATRLNGTSVRLRGGGAESCGTVKARAFEASYRRLAPAMPDAAARRTFIEAEFAAADRFLAAAARSEDITVGEEPSAPQCRTDNAQN